MVRVFVETEKLYGDVRIIDYYRETMHIKLLTKYYNMFNEFCKFNLLWLKVYMYLTTSRPILFLDTSSQDGNLNVLLNCLYMYQSIYLNTCIFIVQWLKYQVCEQQAWGFC